MQSFDYFIFFIFSLIYYVQFVNCASECINLDISIIQKVEHEGFRREIKWLIETASPTNEVWQESNCKLCLKLDVSNGMFVNPDEIAELNRTQKLQIFLDGNVDIEAPAHEASEHSVYFFLNGLDIARLSVKLPVHLRYQRGQITGGYGKVPLRKPSLLVWCPKHLVTVCGRGLKVEAPCDVAYSQVCVWKNHTYQALFDDVELFVPVGDLDDYPLVSIVSLLLGCAGCVYILSILSTTPL
ncbi:unnamed protein product [Acanthoscelides obtectus]|uniref:Phosphatidylinositol-glycan biosynthesis class X protein n=1 Tax=Acanthoscelides obtectus TaxID=200917 RepID=A0A9P0JPD8_ACAOB|nr:unnamed protein product [Acanthoscelides obtectus]CAK1667020.1 Phosphatidylinositol-glycan biosynthesis class X protein [Acanthoscelides obtectus]